MHTLFRTKLRFATAACITAATIAVAHAEPVSTANTLAQEPIPELFEHPDGQSPEFSEQYQNTSVVHQMMIGDGWVDFVLQPNQSIGIAYVGDIPGKAVSTLLTLYKATPLEVFNALNHSRDSAPRELLKAHLTQSKKEINISKIPRQLPKIDTLLNDDTQTAGHFGESFSGAGECAGNQDFALFTNWFSSYGPTGSTVATNNPSYKDLGVKGIYDDGEDSGSANITLLGSPGGAIAFCKTSGDNGKPTLRISEDILGVGWKWVYQFNNVMNSGSARGYYYGGSVLRNFRMEIRDAAGVEYFWAAAY